MNITCGTLSAKMLLATRRRASTVRTSPCRDAREVRKSTSRAENTNKNCVKLVRKNLRNCRRNCNHCRTKLCARTVGFLTRRVPPRPHLSEENRKPTEIQRQQEKRANQRLRVTRNHRQHSPRNLTVHRKLRLDGRRWRRGRVRSGTSSYRK